MKPFISTVVVGLTATLASAMADDKWDIAKYDVSKLPAAAQQTGLTFAKDIKPLFDASCTRCHGEERQKGDFRTDSLAAVLKGGEDGKMVVPGKSAKSLLLFSIAQLNPETAMPPKRRSGGPGGPGGLLFGKDEYYLSFVGAPSSTDPWMLQWGGHHLALNITVDGPHGVLTPTHTATQPAKYTWEGKTVRPLGAEYDKAVALMSTLSEEQRKKAIIGSRMADLVLGPGHDGQTLQPEGLKASEMTETQQAAVLDIAHEWVGILNDLGASAKMAELKSNIGETWFAWSGPTTPGSAFYYRIQGPTVVIEFSPQRLGGDPVNHIHTMFRDPSNDYGRKWWKK